MFTTFVRGFSVRMFIIVQMGVFRKFIFYSLVSQSDLLFEAVEASVKAYDLAGKITGYG